MILQTPFPISDYADLVFSLLYRVLIALPSIGASLRVPLPLYTCVIPQITSAGTDYTEQKVPPPLTSVLCPKCIAMTELISV